MYEEIPVDSPGLSYADLFQAPGKDPAIYYNLPDSVKAVQFMAEKNLQALFEKKTIVAGIRTNSLRLSQLSGKGKKVFLFDCRQVPDVQKRGILYMQLLLQFIPIPASGD